MFLFPVKNQIFFYTTCVTPKRVEINDGWAYLRVVAHARNTALFEEMSHQWRTVGNTVSDLTGSKISQFKKLSQR